MASAVSLSYHFPVLSWRESMFLLRELRIARVDITPARLLTGFVLAWAPAWRRRRRQEYKAGKGVPDRFISP